MLTFEEFLLEHKTSIYHWIVTQDEDGEDENQIPYHFKKGEHLTVTDYPYTKDGNAIVNHNGRIYTIPTRDISYFAKLVA